MGNIIEKKKGREQSNNNVQILNSDIMWELRVSHGEGHGYEKKPETKVFTRKVEVRPNLFSKPPIGVLKMLITFKPTPWKN